MRSRTACSFATPCCLLTDLQAQLEQSVADKAAMEAELQQQQSQLASVVAERTALRQGEAKVRPGWEHAASCWPLRARE
jgi:hypothetical protein